MNSVDEMRVSILKDARGLSDERAREIVEENAKRMVELVCEKYNIVFPGWEFSLTQGFGWKVCARTLDLPGVKNPNLEISSPMGTFDELRFWLIGVADVLHNLQKVVLQLKG